MHIYLINTIYYLIHAWWGRWTKRFEDPLMHTTMFTANIVQGGEIAESLVCLTKLLAKFLSTLYVPGSIPPRPTFLFLLWRIRMK